MVNSIFLFVQHIEEHKHSVIGKHFRAKHALTPDNLIKNFKVLKKCCVNSNV